MSFQASCQCLLLLFLLSFNLDYFFAVFGVAFMCHFNALPVHSELNRPTIGRDRCVFNTTMFVGTLIYLLVGFTINVFKPKSKLNPDLCLVGFVGYAYASDYTCGNILLNFSAKDKVMGIARGALSLSLLCTYPLIVLPCRGAVSTLVFLCANDPDSPSAVEAREAEEVVSPAMNQKMGDGLEEGLLGEVSPRTTSSAKF